MSKYENGLNVNLEIWNVAMLTAIANELAETNRLTRLVMNRNENYSDEEDGAKKRKLKYYLIIWNYSYLEKP